MSPTNCATISAQHMRNNSLCKFHSITDLLGHSCSLCITPSALPSSLPEMGQEQQRYTTKCAMGKQIVAHVGAHSRCAKTESTFWPSYLPTYLDIKKCCEGKADNSKICIVSIFIEKFHHQNSNIKNISLCVNFEAITLLLFSPNRQHPGKVRCFLSWNRCLRCVCVCKSVHQPRETCHNGFL